MNFFESSVWNNNLFNGSWTPGSGGSQHVINPSTGESLGQVGLASVENVAEAARRAAAAQRSWAAT